MNRFIRQYKMVIRLAKGEAIEILPPLRIQFEANKSIGTMGLNKFTAKIYNLKESTRLKLVKDEDDPFDEYLQVFFQAGYDDLQTIFRGNIHKAGSIKSGNDFITTIDCLDGGFDYLNSFTAKTVKGKDQAISAILEDMPNTQQGKITQQNQLIRPKVLIGNSGKLIEQQLMENEKFFIDGEKLHILKDDEIIAQGASVINSETGLLSTPERKNKIVTAKTLLNPLIKLGGMAKLETVSAPHLDGIYRVEAMNYKGDLDGQDWEQEVQMRLIPNYKEI